MLKVPLKEETLIMKTEYKGCFLKQCKHNHFYNIIFYYKFQRAVEERNSDMTHLLVGRVKFKGKRKFDLWGEKLKIFFHPLSSSI